MKRVIICLVIFAVMLSAGIGLYIHTESVSDDLTARLTALERGEVPDPVREAEAISADWEDFCAFNIFLTNLEGAAEVSETLVRLAAKARYDPDDIAEECRAAVLTAEHFRASRALRIENVF